MSVSHFHCHVSRRAVSSIKRRGHQGEVLTPCSVQMARLYSRGLSCLLLRSEGFHKAFFNEALRTAPGACRLRQARTWAQHKLTVFQSTQNPTYQQVCLNTQCNLKTVIALFNRLSASHSRNQFLRQISHLEINIIHQRRLHWMYIQTKPGQKYQHGCGAVQQEPYSICQLFRRIWSEETLYKNMLGISGNSSFNDFFKTSYSNLVSQKRQQGKNLIAKRMVKIYAKVNGSSPLCLQKLQQMSLIMTGISCQDQDLNIFLPVLSTRELKIKIPNPQGKDFHSSRSRDHEMDWRRVPGSINHLHHMAMANALCKYSGHLTLALINPDASSGSYHLFPQLMTYG